MISTVLIKQITDLEAIVAQITQHPKLIPKELHNPQEEEKYLSYCLKKGQLADCYYQVAKQYEKDADFKNALKYYELAIELTKHYPSFSRLSCASIPRNEVPRLKQNSQDHILPDSLNATDLYQQGVMFLCGMGRDANPYLAFRYLSAAADLGDAKSLNKLGEMYQEGRGNQVSDVNALKCFKAAAIQNYLPAISNVGRMGHTAPTVIGLKESILWTQLAAEKGYPAALNNLAVTFEAGVVYQQDTTLAELWMLRAATQGFAHSQASLCRHYSSGLYPNGSSELGLIWLKKAAAQKLPQALHALGEIIEKGIEAQPSDKLEAAKLYRQAAQLNDAHAENKLMLIEATFPRLEILYHTYMGLGKDLIPLIKLNPVAVLTNVFNDELLSEAQKSEMLTQWLKVNNNDFNIVTLLETNAELNKLACPYLLRAAEHMYQRNNFTDGRFFLSLISNEASQGMMTGSNEISLLQQAFDSVNFTCEERIAVSVLTEFKGMLELQENEVQQSPVSDPEQNDFHSDTTRTHDKSTSSSPHAFFPRANSTASRAQQQSNGGEQGSSNNVVNTLQPNLRHG